jgi:hypothetical protein
MLHILSGFMGGFTIGGAEIRREGKKQRYREGFMPWVSFIRRRFLP